MDLKAARSLCCSRQRRRGSDTPLTLLRQDGISASLKRLIHLLTTCKAGIHKVASRQLDESVTPLLPPKKFQHDTFGGKAFL